MDITNLGYDLSIFSNSQIESLAEDFKRAMKENVKMSKDRVFNVLYCSELLSSFTIGKGVRIRVEFGTINSNMASITILGKNVGFTNTSMFNEISKRSTNFEAYAKENKEVELVFTFRHMINK